MLVALYYIQFGASIKRDFLYYIRLLVFILHAESPMLLILLIKNIVECFHFQFLSFSSFINSLEPSQIHERICVFEVNRIFRAETSSRYMFFITFCVSKGSTGSGSQSSRTSETLTPVSRLGLSQELADDISHCNSPRTMEKEKKEKPKQVSVSMASSVRLYFSHT